MSQDTERLPITSAKPMAWLSISMSMGFVLILYTFFLKDAFDSSTSLALIAAMVVLALISSAMALKNVRKKLLCDACHAPFFSRTTQLFYSPKQCASCNKPVSPTK